MMHYDYGITFQEVMARVLALVLAERAGDHEMSDRILAEIDVCMLSDLLAGAPMVAEQLQAAFVAASKPRCRECGLI